MFSSDDGLLDVAVPFLEDGAAAGEPTFVVLGEHGTELVRRAVGEQPGITYLDGAREYARPATTIRTFRDVVARNVAAGAHQVRVIGEVPHPGIGVPWDQWARYEAVVNRALAPFPLWGICPYDVRRTPDHVLDDVARTHPHLATRDGRHERNDRFEDPTAFVQSRISPVSDPLESQRPLVSLHDPTPSAARSAIVRAAVGSATVPLDVEALADLAVAVSETVTNALVYGGAPVTVKAWAAAERFVVTVHDRGHGPTDPSGGLVPRPDRTRGGLGLWLAHQMCDHVSLFFADDGFTVRLVTGAPHVGSARIDRPG
jgi:anti-sigma regulatory factor (Ser/Thr protein kinase)